MKQSGNEAPLTISGVALQTGVSRATASRALSDYGVVDSETRVGAARLAIAVETTTGMTSETPSPTSGVLVIGESLMDLFGKHGTR